MDLPALIKKKCQTHGLLTHASRIVVGVSGGADSVALLRAFQTLDLSCTVAHLNHQLRGADSDEDEKFVRSLAEELGFPMVEKTVEVKVLAQKSGLSIEMAARQARHDFFAEFEDSVIALAHHADDQVETFLLKLARGAGTDGLSGMPVYQELNGLKLIRPLLDLPRTGIIQWLEENGFDWREDASNSDETFLRNKVRHTILPMLGNELNPNIRETILRTMEILRTENEWMEGWVETENLKFETGIPLAAKRRMLRKWLFNHGAEAAGFEAVEQILQQLENTSGTSIYELNDRQRVVIEYGKPRFEDDDFQSLEISWHISTHPGTGWIRDTSRIGDDRAEASIRADKLGERTIKVRMAQPGDRMAPLGMTGTRKLQDILTDLKVPKMQRPDVPVVVCEGEIIWLPGYRIARGWEVDGTDGKSVHLTLEQNRPL